MGGIAWDNAGLTLVATVHSCADPNQPCPLPNAFWNGTQMVFGDGFASADDITAHELTHEVTQYSANLFYYMQSGALNSHSAPFLRRYIEFCCSNMLLYLHMRIAYALPHPFRRSQEE